MRIQDRILDITNNTRGCTIPANDSFDLHKITYFEFLF